MVAISSSQKKTVFAVVLLALIAVGVMISGRGGFSGLRSDIFNNPSFVCSEATQTADKEKYDRSGADIQNFSAEKAGLQTKIQGWNADIRKNDAQIKKLEKEETAAEKKERALEIAVKKQCTPRALATCAAKKQELQDVRQEIKQIRNSLVSERNQNKNIRTNIQNAESNIKLLEKQILELQNFKADYETCKKALEKEKTEVSSFDLIVSGEVFVNEPFDITVRAMKSADIVNNKYEGKIFFDTNNNPADVVLPLQENDGGSEYQFQAADNGIKLFEKGLTLKKAGVYEIVVFELRGPNGGINKTVQVVAKDKITIDGICGNGIKEGSEQCDDGNTNNDDSCSNICQANTPNNTLPVQVSRQISQEIVDGGGFFTLEPNTAGQKIGSFIIKNPNISEAVRVTKMHIGFSRITYSPGSLINLTTSGSAAGIIPQGSNTISVDFTIPANSEKVFDIFVDTGAAQQSNVMNNVVISDITTVGLDTNNVNKTPAGYGFGYYDFMVKSNSITRVSGGSGGDYSGYIAAAGGGTSKANYCFSTERGGLATITELKFHVNGENTIRTIKVNDVSVAVTNNTAVVYGAGIKVNSSGSSCADILIGHTGVGVGGISSGTESSLDLKYVKYEINGVIKELEPSVSHLAPVRTLVGSKPTLSAGSGEHAGLVLNSQNKLSEVTISADPKGNIKINDLPFIVHMQGIGDSKLTNLRIVDENGYTIPGSVCTEAPLVLCEFGSASNEDSEGYLIPAGASKKFHLYGTVNGFIEAPDRVRVTTTLGYDFYFSWDDAMGNGQNVTNLNGKKIYGYPTGPGYVLVQ